MNKKQSGGSSVQAVQAIAARIAADLNLELVEVTLHKEPQGKTLCIFLDKDGGFSMDDCEQFHRAIQPQLDNVDYDYLEVSSPGVDRPIKTQRDFERNRDALVEVRLFAPIDGVKSCEGNLRAFDDESVTIACADGNKTFARKAVAIIKPIIIFEDEEL